MPRHVLRSLLAPAVLLILSGCSERAPVHVRAFFQSGIPLPGLEISAVPFDVDRLLDSLALVAPSPRPTFPGIEARIQSYRRREAGAANVSVSDAWMATRDTVVRMARELSRQDRKSAGYREAYARFRQAYVRFTAREAEREAQMRGLFATDRALAAEATRASDSLRAWERDAYREFPALAESHAARTGRPATTVRTDSLGRAELELENGGWWVSARIPDPDNPFQELRWSLPVRIAAGLPLGLPLMRANATVQWRH